MHGQCSTNRATVSTIGCFIKYASSNTAQYVTERRPRKQITNAVQAATSELALTGAAIRTSSNGIRRRSSETKDWTIWVKKVVNANGKMLMLSRYLDVFTVSIRYWEKLNCFNFKNKLYNLKIYIALIFTQKERNYNLLYFSNGKQLVILFFTLTMHGVRSVKVAD